MKIKQHIRVAVQSMLATFLVALVVVAGTQAATTIGNNISTGTLTASGIADITGTTDTVLTVNGGTSSTTFAVYQSSTGDIVNVFDGQTEVFTVLDGGKTGVGSSTPYAVFSIEAADGVPAFTVGSSTNGVHNDLLSVAVNGALTVNNVGAAEADVTIQGDSLNNLFTTDASADRVGIASSTPWGLLAVEQATETYSFIVMNQGSTTPAFVVNGANDGVGSRVGVSSSTPYGLFSVGMDAPGAATGTMVAVGFNDTANGTTTFDLGRACFQFVDDGGAQVFMWPSLNHGLLGAWATSTTSCF